MYQQLDLYRICSRHTLPGLSWMQRRSERPFRSERGPNRNPRSPYINHLFNRCYDIFLKNSYIPFSCLTYGCLTKHEFQTSKNWMIFFSEGGSGVRCAEAALRRLQRLAESETAEPNEVGQCWTTRMVFLLAILPDFWPLLNGYKSISRCFCWNLILWVVRAFFPASFWPDHQSFTGSFRGKCDLEVGTKIQDISQLNYQFGEWTLHDFSQLI